MKMRRLRNIISWMPASGYSSALISYPVMLLISLWSFIIIFYQSIGSYPPYNEVFSYPDGIFDFDSYEYLRAVDNVWAGRPDISRTPVYPLFLGLMERLGGTQYAMKLVMIFQYLIFLLSGLLLYKCSFKLTGSHKISFWIMGCYIMPPFMIIWSCKILTESLAISGVVFLIWFLIRDFPKSPSVNSSFLAGFILFLLAFLRPVLLCLIPIMAGYFIFMYYRTKRQNLRSLISGCVPLAITIGCVVYYGLLVHSIYNIHTISDISNINNFYTATQCIGYHPEMTENLELKELLINHPSSPDDPGTALHSYMLRGVSLKYPVEFEEYTNKVMKLSSHKLLPHIFKRLIYETPVIPFQSPTVYYPFQYIERLFTPTLSFVWLILAWAIGLCVRYIRKKKKVPVIFCFLILTVLAIDLSCVIGAMSDWGRLFLPSISAFLLIIAKMCSMYKMKPGREVYVD